MNRVDRLKQEDLNSLLRYCPTSGNLYWWHTKGRAKAGNIAGSVNNSGYRQIGIGGRNYMAHRIIWKMIYDSCPSNLDHINHDRLDNRIENLRPCTRSQNQMNMSHYSGGTSKYRGVHFCGRRNKWIAKLKAEKNIYIGQFDCEYDAATAYNFAASEYFGEFANLNIVEIV